MNRQPRTLLAGLGALVFLCSAWACGSGPPPRVEPEPPRPEEADPPETTLERMRDRIEHDRWDHVYLLMSARARRCYTEGELETFFTRTQPGNLELSRLLHWRLAEVEVDPEEARGRMVLVHWRNPEYRWTYPLVLEGKFWRLDWSLADLFQVPRDVEDCE